MLKYLTAKFNTRHFGPRKSVGEEVETDICLMSTKHSTIAQGSTHYLFVTSGLRIQGARSMFSPKDNNLHIGIYIYIKKCDSTPNQLCDLLLQAYYQKKNILLRKLLHELILY